MCTPVDAAKVASDVLSIRAAFTYAMPNWASANFCRDLESWKAAVSF